MSNQNTLLFRYLILALLGYLLCLMENASAAAEEDRLSFAVYAPAMRDISRADIETSFKVWAEEVAGQVNVPIAVRIYDQMEDLKKDADRGIINFFILDGAKLLSYLKIEDLADGVSGTPPGKSGALLIASSGSGITSLKDMAGKRLSLLSDHLFSDVAVDTLCLRTFGKPYSKVFSEVLREKKNQQLVLKTFFDKTDVALVWATAFDVAVEMNPQIRQKVKIIAELPHNPGLMGVFSTRLSPEFRNRLLTKISAVNTLPRGKQILEIMQLGALQKSPHSELVAINALIKERESLMTKYQNQGKGGAK